MKRNRTPAPSQIGRRPLDDGLLPARKKRGNRPRGDHWLAWTIFLLLLTALACACWMGSFHIFSHPEDPRSYAILTKLKKLDPLKRYLPTKAPKGRFHTVGQAVKLYAAMSPEDLQAANLDLFRSWLRNYPDKSVVIPYLTGRFSVISARALGPTDLVTSGYVALARSLDDAAVRVELLYPAAAEYQEDLARMLVPGVEVKLERTFDLSAVLHVEREGGQTQFTVVPLNYDSYRIGDGRVVQLAPPDRLNMRAALPMFPGGRSVVQEGGKQPAGNDARPVQMVRAGPTPDMSVMRVAKALPVDGPAAPLPRISPLPKPTSTPTGADEPTGTTPALKVTPSPTPKTMLAEASPVPSASPSPTPRTVLVSGAAPTPASRRWTVYPPGRMPRGRLVDVPDLARLEKSGVGENTYLQGSFVVTAADSGRAVLRSTSGLASALGLGRATAGSTRIIVLYPEGAAAPPEGSAVRRDGNRPFQVTGVQRSSNGQLNVYVREVTTP